MYHSITIGEKNTWDDWHLIPATRPLFNPPAVKTSEIDIPGGDGALDLTAALSGRPTYANRTGNWTFYVQNGFKDWYDIYSEIMMYLHGQKYKAILEDDPGFYYEGRFSVNQWCSDKDWSQIVIDYNVGPYKKEIGNDGSGWLWDSFNFENGIIRNYNNISVLGTISVTIVGDSSSHIPVIFASESGMTVEFEENEYDLIKGANIIPEIVLQQGENILVFTGNGTISISNIWGRL